MKQNILKVVLFVFLAFCTHANEKIDLNIKTKDKTINYLVEVADTQALQEKGLMNRKALPSNHGMLFLFNGRKMRYFWMKNTYISLDILFIDCKNKIKYIVKNTTPLSDKVLPSLYPVCKVLELNADQVKKNNIQVGDVIHY